MPAIDFSRLAQWIDITESALKLLAPPERQLIMNLNIRGANGQLLTADVFVVYHNTARGPAKGGIRIAPDVTLAETADLAERMVWKTALVKVPFGGGKSGISIDPAKLNSFERAEMMREYVHLLEYDLMGGVYIPAPDLGSRPADMATIYGQTHLLTSVTGKPPRVGGLPGRKEATGRGVAHSAKLALEKLLKRSVSSATFAVQGFGNVGSWAAKFIRDMGGKVVAVSDARAGRYSKSGLDVDDLMKRASAAGILPDDAPGDRIGNAELLALDVDVLMPCAVENVLTAKTAPKVKAKLIVEGANGPTTPEGDAALESMGVVAVPDILANSGGVIASYIEWRNAKSGALTDRNEVFESLEKVISRSFDEVCTIATDRKISHRRAAECVAVGEVIAAMQDRNWI